MISQLLAGWDNFPAPAAHKNAPKDFLWSVGGVFILLDKLTFIKKVAFSSFDEFSCQCNTLLCKVILHIPCHMPLPFRRICLCGVYIRNH